jgi:hypothetical protein
MTGKTKGADDKADSRDVDGKLEDDVEEHRYYYDDAHGYEEFDPAEKDESDDEEQRSGS